MRIITTAFLVFVAWTSFAQCTLSERNSAISTVVDMKYDTHGFTSWKVRHEHSGWEVDPHASFDSVSYVLNDGRRLVQYALKVPDTLVEVFISTPLDSVVIYKNSRMRVMHMSRSPAALGDACKCIKDAIPPDQARPTALLPAVPGSSTPTISAGELIASGSREMNSGTVIVGVGGLAALAIASGGDGRGVVPAALVGGVTGVIGIVLNFDGHKKVARGGDRLKSLGL